VIQGLLGERSRAYGRAILNSVNETYYSKIVCSVKQIYNKNTIITACYFALSISLSKPENSGYFKKTVSQFSSIIHAFQGKKI